MSTSASASKIPNKKILKKSRKSDLLEDRLLVLVEQDVSLPRDAQIVQLEQDPSISVVATTESSSSSEANLGTSSNSAPGS